MTASALVELRTVEITWFTVRFWNELTWDYDDLVGHVEGDRRDDLLSRHEPPLIIIVSVRYGNEKARYP